MYQGYQGYQGYQPYQSTWNNPYMQGYQQVQPVNGIVKVKSRESAMQAILPPNSTSQPMFDENKMCFYVVSTDGTGSKSLEWFDYAPHVDEPVQVQMQTVSREEFDALAEKVREMEARNNGIDESASKRTAKQPAGGRGDDTRQP